MKTFSSVQPNKQKVLKFKYFIKVALSLGPKLIPKARNVCMDFIIEGPGCVLLLCAFCSFNGWLGAWGPGENKLIFSQVFSVLNLLNITVQLLDLGTCQSFAVDRSM